MVMEAETELTLRDWTYALSLYESATAGGKPAVEAQESYFIPFASIKGVLSPTSGKEKRASMEAQGEVVRGSRSAALASSRA